MRIVHVVYSLEMGGAEMLVAQLCRLQRAEGHDVSVCCYSNLDIIGEAMRAEGVDIYVPGEAHPLKTMWRYFRYFRKRKPDVVHTHNPAPTLQGAISARLAGVRAVIATRHRLEPLPYHRPTEFRFGLAARFVDWVTGISQITCDMAMEAPWAPKDKILLVYNGTVPVAEVRPEDLPQKKGFTVLFIGRLAPEKDLGTAIRAVKIAVESLPDLQFWIVGGGRVRDELDALVEELGMQQHITFWGQRLDTAQFFRGADAFLMSSITEGLPVSLLQAMSAGMPAVITDVDGGAEILRLSHSGLMAPIGDAKGLAEQIVRMANDAEMRKEFSQRARQTYEERFTLQHMNDEYMKLYRLEYRKPTA